MIFHTACVKTLSTLHVYFLSLMPYLSSHSFLTLRLKGIEASEAAASRDECFASLSVGPVLQVCVGLPLFIY